MLMVTYFFLNFEGGGSSSIHEGKFDKRSISSAALFIVLSPTLLKVTWFWEVQSQYNTH